MNISEYIKIRKDLSETDRQALVDIQNKIETAIPSITIAEEYITEILNLLHEGVTINKNEFIREVFFEFVISTKKLIYHKTRIYDELSQLKRFKPNSIEESTHLINIYRNVISDLFDPYISLVIACLQFKEGRFINFLYSNLGQGERNKYEYAIARLKSTNLFSGYNPIVRNAISHTGTDSIKYENNHIIFRNIKRGNPPIISYEKWTTDELQKNILSLLNFIHAIDFAIELFGIDIGNEIKEDKQLFDKFIDEILDQDHRMEIQESLDSLVEKINKSDKLNEKEKIDVFTNILFVECSKRVMPIDSAKFNTKDKVVLLELPEKTINHNDDSELIGRLMELFRYGIIAEPCYRNLFNQIIVREISNENKEVCKIIGNSSEFRKYGDEKAGLIDLLKDCEVFINGDKLTIDIDFNKLQELDNENIERSFPRKER